MVVVQLEIIPASLDVGMPPDALKDCVDGIVLPSSLDSLKRELLE